MCSNRNLVCREYTGFIILDHWEMCSNRNAASAIVQTHIILDHWEMCSNRNIVAALGLLAGDFRSLGNVL